MLPISMNLLYHHLKCLEGVSLLKSSSKVFQTWVSDFVVINQETYFALPFRKIQVLQK